MTATKSLFKDTAIYGISSIVGKFLNWLLTPIWTYVLVSAGHLGVINYLYSWTALAMVILTYGMETGLFRFSNKNKENPDTVYSTVLISIGVTSILFIILAGILINPITSILNWLNHSKEIYQIAPRYLILLILILAIDAFSAIPFAKLRLQKRPIRFAAIKIINILITIFLNIVFFIILPILSKKYPESFSWFTLEHGIDFILISNLVASFIQLIILSPELIIKYKFDFILIKKILKYSSPLIILGIVGILNQNFDKIIFPYLYSDESKDAMVELGKYGSAFKIAIIIVMFTQAFRYAFEPFMFSQKKDDKNNKESYAIATKIFIIFTLFIYILVIGYMDIIKYLIAPPYREALKVVPFIMFAELIIGIYFNLSVWYKLTDKTKWGAYISIIGLIITIVLNVLLIPKFGYMGCAYASVVASIAMLLVSYFIGQKYYPIKYDLKNALKYFIIASIINTFIVLTNRYIDNSLLKISINSIFILLYIIIVLKTEPFIKNNKIYKRMLNKIKLLN